MTGQFFAAAQGGVRGSAKPRGQYSIAPSRGRPFQPSSKPAFRVQLPNLCSE